MICLDTNAVFAAINARAPSVRPRLERALGGVAAQARRRGALLVTANEREFARVPGLRCEDWARPA